MPDKNADIDFIEPINPLGLFRLDDPYELNLNNNQCYKQKYSEDCTIQVKSFYPPTAEILAAYTGYPTGITPTITEKTTDISPDYGFGIYEITYPFGSIVGEYIAVLSYTDDDAVMHSYQTLVVSCKANHPNTLLFQYRNSENNFGIDFNTGIVFNLRVEGVIRSPTFESNDTIYNDLNEDSIILDSVPYNTFKLICGVGNNGLLPDWMGDKINRVLSCDETAINSRFYSKVDGEKLEIKRPDPRATKDKPSLSLSTTIQPVLNNSLQKLILGANSPQGYVPMSHYYPFFNVGADFSYNAPFNGFSLLTKVVVKNKGAVIPSFGVGTAPGLDNLAKFTPIPAIGDRPRMYPVDIDQDVIDYIYFTGLNGANCDIYLHWYQFDEKEVVPGRETTIVKMPYRAVVDVAGTRADLDQLFDFGTGLGRVGTDYETARICDGRNGTQDMGLRVRMSYKDGARWSDLGLTVADDPLLNFGEDNIGQYTTVLTAPNLPPLSAILPSATGAGGGRIKFDGGGNGLYPAPVKGESAPGSQNWNVDLISKPFTNIQPAVIVLTVQFF